MTSQALETTSGEIIPYPTAPTTLFQSTEPADIVKRASAVASALAPVIEKQGLYTNIHGKRHVNVGAWTLLGSMLGVFPIPVWTKPIEGGYMARVEARTISGQLVGAAEAQCTRTDWQNGKTATDNALLSMAQTRATSKAMRLPLGFVVTLAGYDATPAEEMDGVASVTETREQARSRASQRPQSAPQRRAPEPVEGQSELISPDDLPFDEESPDGPADVATLRRLAKAGEAVQMDKDAVVAFVKAQHGVDSPRKLTQQQAGAIIARWEASAE